ncbi:hypothetical protein SK803_18810 [Lentzea sp. BCCO 10_0856]|uniref:Uncharacterized protein n=1 Tax=Lentzea miocenica TaxID=3095431 RepID=A0ABU4T2E7_9PSEU|nr:hypothetical protein [Lentzea sp. BCCO 10_0856]MDX8032275.1 hypothetical protein [Lentzea sp. BCCO 10_0856]
MSWLRRLLLLAGLLTGAWLLGSAGEANADVKVAIDQLEVEVRLPVVDIGVKVETGLVPHQPDAPVPSKPDPRVETPPPLPVAPQPPQPDVKAPVQAEVPQQHPAQPALTTRPTNPVPVPQQPQPQAEQPITGTLPQSGAGASSSGGQIPVGTLPHVMRPPTTTTSLISTEQQDVPRIVRAEEPTFSPD